MAGLAQGGRAGFARFDHVATNPVVAVTAVAEPFDNRKGVSLNAVALRSVI